MNEQLQGATTQTASAQPLFNPLSPDFIRDPYPSYDKLRTHAPVLHLPALNGYLVSRNADAALVLRDKRFGKDYVTRITRRWPEALNEPVYRAMGRWMLTQDPPDHTRLRGLVVKAFTARRVEDMRPKIQAIVDDSIDRVIGQGRMDLISDFAFRLPVIVICDMLGIPETDREIFFKRERTGGRLLDPAQSPCTGRPSVDRIARLPFAERLAHWRDPSFRARVLGEAFEGDRRNRLVDRWDRMFPLGDPPDYEPAPDQSIAAIAERQGRPAAEVAYDLMLERDGRQILYLPVTNYVAGNLDVVREMIDRAQHAARTGRRRRPCRHHVRRHRDQLHTDPLDARPRPRRAVPGGVGGQAPVARQRRGDRAA